MRLRSLLLLSVLFSSVCSFAQQGYGNRYGNGQWNDEQSTLSIYSENGEQFFMVLNGISQNNVPASKVRVEGLPKYGNDVEIVFADRRTMAIRKRLTISDPVDGKAVHMVLKIVRGRDGQARLKFHKCTEVDRDYRAPDDEYCMSYGQPRRTDRRNNNYNDRPTYGPVPMDAATFNEAKRTISNSSFDQTRLSTAQTILNTNYVTTDQVIEICRLFSFEESMLKFAKFAYARTVDANNYFKVGSIFTFDSNKQALNDFISGGRR